VADWAEGELPRPDQEGENEGDQEVVEELQRVADDGGRARIFFWFPVKRAFVDRAPRTWRFPSRGAVFFYSPGVAPAPRRC